MVISFGCGEVLRYGAGCGLRLRMEDSTRKIIGRIIGLDILVRRVMTDASLMMIAANGNTAEAAETQKNKVNEWMADIIGDLLKLDLGIQDQDGIKREAALSIEHNIEAVLDNLEERANAIVGIPN
jgi:hypothetical protein